MSKRYRKFKGFAVLDERGNLIWGTLSTREDWARQSYDKHNPDPTGQGGFARTVPVTISVKSNPSD